MRTIIFFICAFQTFGALAADAPAMHAPKRVDFPAGKLVVFSADSKQILTADTHRVLVFDAQTLQPLSPIMDHPDVLQNVGFGPSYSSIFGFAFTYHAPKMVSGDARFWELKSGKLQFGPYVDGKSPPHIAALSPDGQVLAISSIGSRVITTVDVVTGHRKSRIQLEDEVRYAVFATNKKLVCCTRREASTWDVLTGQEGASRFSAGAEIIVQPSISRDGGTLVLTSDKTFTVFDLNSGKRVADNDENALPLDIDFTALSVCGDGSRIVTVANRAGGQVWDSRTGMPLSKLINGALAGAAISDNGEYVIFQGLLGVFEAETGKVIQELSEGGFSCASFSPDHKRFCLGYGANGGYALIYDLVPRMK